MATGRRSQQPDVDDQETFTLKDIALDTRATKLNTEAILTRLTVLESRVSTIEDNVKSVTTLSDDVSEMKKTISLLSARLVRTEITADRMHNELVSLKSHSMKNNLIFSFDSSTDIGRDIRGEDSIGVIRSFLATVMHVPDVDKMFIPVAHRLGKPVQGKTRAILAQFPVSSQLGMVLKHTNRLRGTRHYVNKQTPQPVKERQQFSMDAFKENRGSARLVNDKLYIDGRLQTQFQEVSLPYSDHVVPIDAASVPVGNVIQDAGSLFKGYALPANTLVEVKKCMNLILQLPHVTNSSHIIYAYRVESTDTSKVLENFNSDDDHIMGLDLLKMLCSRDARNTLCSPR